MTGAQTPPIITRQGIPDGLTTAGLIVRWLHADRDRSRPDHRDRRRIRVIGMGQQCESGGPFLRCYQDRLLNVGSHLTR